jgi:hypothetical protein
MSNENETPFTEKFYLQIKKDLDEGKQSIVGRCGMCQCPMKIARTTFYCGCVECYEVITGLFNKWHHSSWNDINIEISKYENNFINTKIINLQFEDLINLDIRHPNMKFKRKYHAEDAWLSFRNPGCSFRCDDPYIIKGFYVDQDIAHKKGRTPIYTFTKDDFKAMDWEVILG